MITLHEHWIADTDKHLWHCVCYYCYFCILFSIPYQDCYKGRGSVYKTVYLLDWHIIHSWQQQTSPNLNPKTWAFQGQPCPNPAQSSVVYVLPHLQLLVILLMDSSLSKVKKIQNISWITSTWIRTIIRLTNKEQETISRVCLQSATAVQ